MSSEAHQYPKENANQLASHSTMSGSAVIASSAMLRAWLGSR